MIHDDSTSTHCIDKLCRHENSTVTGTETTHMVDSPLDTDDDPGAPRWVKVSGIIVIVLVLLVVVMKFAGHLPGRHMLRHVAPPSSVSDDKPGDRTPPAGVR